MSSASVQYFDYYEFLGVSNDADPRAIVDAIEMWSEKNKHDRVHPDLMRDVDRREARLDQARKILLDPERRRAYDEEHNRRAAQQGTGLLWLEPEFVFDANDLEPAQTVPALARKLDDDWPRAIEALKSRSVEQMLRFVRPRQPAATHPRYTALENEIRRLRTTLGDQHPYRMLESTIVLCDARLERPNGRVDDQPIEGAKLTVQQVRPDQPQTVKFRLQRSIDIRGCLFGHAWIEDSWAKITSPAPERFMDDGKEMSGAYFELVGNGSAEFTVSMPTSELLKLKRPETHDLHIAFGLQPDTAHYYVARCVMPVSVTPIPANATFEPAQVTHPVARRGAKLTATARLVNKGEAPLNAQRILPADSDVAVEQTLGETGGEVRVTVDTSHLPYGAPFSKLVRYMADGDTPSVTLEIGGELLPTPWQHLFRLQPARDRITLAGLFALYALCLGPILTRILDASVLFMVIAGLLLIGGAVGVTRVIARSAVRHIQASGDTNVTNASIPLSALLLGVGGGLAVVVLVIAIIPLEPWQKAFWYTSLGALIAAAWGFFFNEDLAVYKRKPTVSRVVTSTPTQLSTAWQGTAEIALIVLFIAALVFDASLVGSLLLLSIPIGIVLLVQVGRS